jgi:hypothetical protein
MEKSPFLPNTDIPEFGLAHFMNWLKKLPIIAEHRL